MQIIMIKSSQRNMSSLFFPLEIHRKPNNVTQQAGYWGQVIIVRSSTPSTNKENFAFFLPLFGIYLHLLVSKHRRSILKFHSSGKLKADIGETSISGVCCRRQRACRAKKRRETSGESISRQSVSPERNPSRVALCSANCQIYPTLHRSNLLARFLLLQK